MKETRAETLDEVFGWVNAYTKDFFFRGVSRAERELVPRVGRHPEKCTPELVADAEIELIKKFKRRSRPFLPEAVTEWELLAIMQHHGVPTRLLDWTRNPLVAFFSPCKKNTTSIMQYMSLSATKLSPWTTRRRSTMGVLMLSCPTISVLESMRNRGHLLYVQTLWSPSLARSLKSL